MSTKLDKIIWKIHYRIFLKIYFGKEKKFGETTGYGFIKSNTLFEKSSKALFQNIQKKNVSISGETLFPRWKEQCGKNVNSLGRMWIEHNSKHELRREPEVLPSSRRAKLWEASQYFSTDSTGTIRNTEMEQRMNGWLVGPHPHHRDSDTSHSWQMQTMGVRQVLQ